MSTAMAGDKKMMKAAVVHELGKGVTIEDVEVPKVSVGKVLIKIEASGVCHTDVHAMMGDWPQKPKTPFIPGHEGVGTIVEMGENVSGFAIGDRVGIPWLHQACGHCRHCLSGDEALCTSQDNTGYSVNGTFAEYCLADAGYIAKIPDNLKYEEVAPILCAGVTVYKGLKRAQVKAGEWVAIIGIGGLGHLAIQYATAMGLNVAAMDIDEEKLKAATRLGAKVVVDGRDSDAPEKIRLATGGGVHAALSTAVSTKPCEQGVEMLRSGGTLVLIGLPPGRFQLPVSDIVLRGFTVRGSIVGSRIDLMEALSFAEQHRVHCEYTVEPLSNVNDIIERLKQGKVQGRIVVAMPTSGIATQ